VDVWRVVRLAVKQAHALGIEFRIGGADVEISDSDRLPDKLRTALDPELLYEYFGAAEADEEAIEFLEKLGVEAILVTDAEMASAALDELEAEGSPFIGLDIETAPKPEYAEPRPLVKVNADGSVGNPAKDKRAKTRRPSGTDPNRADVATVQLHAGGKRCFVLRGAAIDYVFTSPWFAKQNFIAHNSQFEAAFLEQRGITVNIGCTMQAGGLAIGVGFGGEKRSLANVSTEVLGLDPPKQLQLSDWSSPRLSEGQVAYAATDAVLAYQLWPKLRVEIATKQRTEAYLLQRRAIPAVAAMETYGLRIDQEEHARQTADWAEKLAEARRTFRDIAGDPPPTNDNEVRDWLFRTVPQEDLARWPRTDKGRQLSVEGKHLKRVLDLPGTKEVIAMRALQQRLSNFGPKLIGFISPATGRIHASYNLAATKAGRFSCTMPNLQQLPGDKADPQFRRCVVPAPGYVLIGCDWAQVEMRAAGWLSGCRAMTAIYAVDPIRDIHRETAAAIARVPYDLVTAEQRQAAKAPNFGAIYGIGPVTLAEDAFDSYGVLMTDAEAQLALDRFFATYTGFDDWRWAHWNICKAAQRVVVPGSGRTVEAAWEHNGALRFTQCCNIPISGRCADAMLLALQLAHARLQGLDAHLVASVHDELLVEANERGAERAHTILEETMAEAFVLTFPGAPSHGVAEAVIGANWFDIKHPQKESKPEKQASAKM